MSDTFVSVAILSLLGSFRLGLLPQSAINIFIWKLHSYWMFQWQISEWIFNSQVLLTVYCLILVDLKSSERKLYCFANILMGNSMKNFSGFIFQWEKDVIPIIFTNAWEAIDKILDFILYATFEMRATPPLLPENLSENWFWPCL